MEVMYEDELGDGDLIGIGKRIGQETIESENTKLK